LIGVCLFFSFVCTINYIISSHPSGPGIPYPVFLLCNSMARKRIRLQDDSYIKELENKLTDSISSNSSLNSLADLTSLAASLNEPNSVLKAIYACYRIFVLLTSKGYLMNPTDEQTNVVRTWIFERLDENVRFLCGLLQDEESLLRVCHLETSACYPYIQLRLQRSISSCLS
jgi:U3 small nucleolar RNA-associated protein 19